MLLKEKIFLANCDPVRRLTAEELEKRFLLGVTFANGVIVTPSLLLDNKHFGVVLKRKNLLKWYREEGAGTLVIRLPGEGSCASLTEFFDALPETYILNRFQGQTKASLSRLQLKELRENLIELDTTIRQYEPSFESVALKPHSLSNRIVEGRSLPSWTSKNPESAEKVELLAELATALKSRSEWYAAADRMLAEDAAIFKIEVIDSAYHSLFIGKGEAFSMDRVALLDNIPAPILDTSISMRALRREIQFIGYALKAFEMIASLGTNEIIKFLTNEALGYLEDKTKDTGIGWATRKNWFGLYEKLTKSVGVEIK